MTILDTPPSTDPLADASVENALQIVRSGDRDHFPRVREDMLEQPELFLHGEDAWKLWEMLARTAETTAEPKRACRKLMAQGAVALAYQVAEVGRERWPQKPRFHRIVFEICARAEYFGEAYRAARRAIREIPRDHAARQEFWIRLYDVATMAKDRPENLETVLASWRSERGVTAEWIMRRTTRWMGKIVGR